MSRADRHRRNQVQRSWPDLVTRVAAEHAFSGVIHITHRGEILASAASGLACRTHGVRNTVDTRFAIASGTKLFTALGIGALIDDGELALETRIHDLPPFDRPGSLPGAHRDVTIRHLLGHTSGVYDYYDEERLADDGDFDSFEMPIAGHRLLRPGDYLPMVSHGPIKFPPGQRFAYSNGGYVLLGIVIEQLTGDYHDFIQSRILARAGMEGSGFFRFDQLPGNTATGYIDSETGWRSNIYQLPIIGGPDGGAYVTAGDMPRLWRALLAGELLSPELTRTFVRRAVQARENVHHGHGVWIRQEPGQRPVLYIVGCDAGVSFRSSCHGRDITVTVISNTTRGAWPVIAALDAEVCERFPPEQRGFAFDL